MTLAESKQERQTSTITSNGNSIPILYAVTEYPLYYFGITDIALRNDVIHSPASFDVALLAFVHTCIL